MKQMVTCSNVPILSIPDFNVYQQSIIEVDTRFGEYNECNPDPDTGVFACTTRGGHSGLSPPACTAGGFGLQGGFAFQGKLLLAQPATGVGQCCALATEHKASLWNWFKANSSCQLLGGYTGYTADPDATGGHVQSASECWEHNPEYLREFGSVCNRSSCR